MPPFTKLHMFLKICVVKHLSTVMRVRFFFFFKRTGLTRSLKNVAKQMQRVFKLVTAESHGELKESDHLVLQRHLAWIGNTGISGIVEMEEHPQKKGVKLPFWEKSSNCLTFGKPKFL